MRRKDREITDHAEIVAILRAGTVCRLAFRGGEYPYIIPLNYGFTDGEGATALYFHCAREGEKLEQMRRDPHVAFEITGANEVFHTGGAACSYSMAYESVIGQGILSAVSGEEKRTGLDAIMRQVASDTAFTYPDAMIDGVEVLRLDVRSMTGKRNARKA